MGSFRRYRDIVLVILLLAVPFFFLRASIRAPQEMNVVDRTLARFAAPFQYGAAAFAGSVSSVIGEYAYLVEVKKDNDKLAYENSRLKARLRQLESTEAENHRLSRLLGLKETIADETVSAVVVAKDTTEYFRVFQVTLDHSGDRPGTSVRENMPVFALDGTVGTVRRVAGDKVDVQLTVDSGFGVDVVVDRTQARGFVRGTGDRSAYRVRVEYVQRSDEVAVGDLLLTSGVGCRFPKGIPVARVVKVIKRDFGIYQEVEASPTVDFSRLQDVLIVLKDTKDCGPREASKRRGPR